MRVSKGHNTDALDQNDSRISALDCLHHTVDGLENDFGLEMRNILKNSKKIGKNQIILRKILS